LYFLSGDGCHCYDAHPEQRRTPLHEKGLPDLVHLDVMKHPIRGHSVRVDKYRRMTFLVNNAGISVWSFEATTPAQAARQFDTNVFG